MDNELLEICKRLEDDSIVSPKGKYLVTKAELIEGAWELRVVKAKEGANEDNK